MDGQLLLAEGCFAQCGPVCVAQGCDLACPFKEEDYVIKQMEVGGENYRPPVDLRGPQIDTLPGYIPAIRHGYGRTEDFAGPQKLVALNLYDVLQHTGEFRGDWVAPADAAAALRRRFRIAPDSEVVVVSTGFDPKLESFAANYDSAKIGARLRMLNLAGMTPPNYSFFRSTTTSPIPRTDVRWNFRRILKACEKLSNDGIPIIPHLNALTQKDWDDWLQFLLERPQIRFVAKEFQTGLRRVEAAELALRRFADLKQKLGRPLHPIFIGGVQYRQEIARIFPNFTFVNSVPFMRAIHRHVVDLEADISLRWIKRATESGEPLDAQLRFNVAHYIERLTRSLAPLPDVIRPAAAFWQLVDQHGWRGQLLHDNHRRFRQGLPLMLRSA